MKQFLAWWQLLRAGNALTAASNVIAGYATAQFGWQPAWPLLVLVVASILLYEAGMLLNDVFDAERDAVERPERPIPSGRISRRAAAAVGEGLLLAGVFAAGLASYLLESPWPAVVGVALALCIVGYDAGLKNTPFGPWVMGACRLLNVLLGSTGAGASWLADALRYALVVGLYAVGLTYYARTENQYGRTMSQVVGGTFVCGATFCVSYWVGKAMGNLLLIVVCWVSLNAFIWLDQGWFAPTGLTPPQHRRRVSRMIFGFLLMDALVVGWSPALVVLSLLVLTWIASRFASMT
jgi:4-hydroxybenzoate polyprenyltransferase